MVSLELFKIVDTRKIVAGLKDLKIENKFINMEDLICEQFTGLSKDLQKVFKTTLEDFQKSTKDGEDSIKKEIEKLQHDVKNIQLQVEMLAAPHKDVSNILRSASY